MVYKEPVDDLDEFIAERTTKNPAFPQLMEATRRRLLRELAKRARGGRPDARRTEKT